MEQKTNDSTIEQDLECRVKSGGGKIASILMSKRAVIWNINPTFRKIIYPYICLGTSIRFRQANPKKYTLSHSQVTRTQ